MATKLEPQQIESRLNPGWATDGDQITKTYEFAQYSHGLLFASALGLIAESMDHHPDLLVSYKKVTVSLSTHSAGGVTELDLELAEAVDRLV